MRLGGYKCIVDKKSKAYKAYGKTEIVERHRHRYEFNNRFRRVFKDKGMDFSGVYPKKSRLPSRGKESGSIGISRNTKGRALAQPLLD